MTLILSGTDGLSDVDGSAATPAIRGTDANTGIFFPAADTIAFSEGGTEAMRIDSSGRVGIGTSSPTARLDVSSTGLSANFGSSTAFAGALWKSSTTTGLGRYVAAEADAMTFGRYGVVEHMRIDSSGNLGIGTSSPAVKLDVAAITAVVQMDSSSGTAGAAVNRYKASNRTWVTGVNATDNTGAYTVYDVTASAERMRIDSSGNLLVGTTSNPENSRFLCAVNSTTLAPINAANSFAGSSGLRTFYSSLGNGTNSVANTNCYHLVALSQGSAYYYLYGNGTTSFTSDQRLKKNIESTRDGYAEDLCKLRVVKYQWKSEPDEGPKELGLIAQEVEQVFPGLVQDATEEINGFTPKVLKASVLPFMLLKALQEQQAIITQLQADVAALKAQP